MLQTIKKLDALISNAVEKTILAIPHVITAIRKNWQFDLKKVCDFESFGGVSSTRLSASQPTLHHSSKRTS